MTPWQLRRLAASAPVTASIISDGCRDYVVEIQRPNGAGLLRTQWSGRRPYRFRSLAEARNLLHRCRVNDVRLRCRVAADEATAGGSGQAAFSELKL